MRSINTSIVALLPVAAILIVGVGLLGAGTLKDLSLALFIGRPPARTPRSSSRRRWPASSRSARPDMKALAARVEARRAGLDSRARRRPSGSTGTATAVLEETEAGTDEQTVAERLANPQPIAPTGPRQQPKRNVPRQQRKKR